MLEQAKEPHRKLDIRSFVLPILLYGSKKVCERLQNAMRSFPENPPFFFEDEKENERLVQDRIETCKIWAAQAERENYETSEPDIEGYMQSQFKMPAELEEATTEKLLPIQEKQKVWSLLVWASKPLDENVIGNHFTIEEAKRLTEDLVKQDKPSHKPKHFHEDSEEKANAIAAVTAAFVLRQWEWIDQNNFVDWCREQLLIAAKRPEPPAEFHDGGTRYSWGYRRSAARALPVLFSKNPEYRKIRKAIIRLAGHRNEEVRAYLFNSLKVLWNVSPETIWSCINVVIKDSRKIAMEGKFRYSRRRLSKAIHILLCRLRTNTSIRNLAVKDLLSMLLEAI